MRITDGVYNPVFRSYAEMMATEIRKRHVKIPPTTTQCASTVRALQLQKTRPKEMDLDWASRPIDPSYLANPNAKTLDDLVNKKDFDATQVVIVEGMRKNPKNTLGASTESLATPEKKAKAVDAFVFTPPAALTGLQIMEAKNTILTAITKYAPTASDLPEVMNVKADSFVNRFYHITPSDIGGVVMAVIFTAAFVAAIVVIVR